MKTFLVGLLAILSLNAFASDKEGGNGGDAVVTSTSAIRLRDMVDPGNCTWKSGKSVLAQADLADVLEKLADANPYLAYRLIQQISNIKWCYTATLKKVNTNDDEESLTYYVDPYAATKIQAGIRVVNNVYIDSSIVAPNFVDGRMISEDRPFFYIHEAMHAFLYMKTPNRNKRVRDAVKAIRDFHVGDTNADDLNTMIMGSELLVPSNESPIPTLIEVIYKPSLSVETRIQMAKQYLDPKNSSEIYEQWKEIKYYLSEDELVTLTRRTGLTRFEFFKRAHKTLIIEPNEPLSFKYNVYDKNLAQSPFGKCNLVLDQSIQASSSIGQYDSAIVFDLRKKMDREAYRNNEFRELMNWAKVVNTQNGQTLTVLPRIFYGENDRYIFYKALPSLQAKQVFESFYTNSLCDFTPTK